MNGEDISLQGHTAFDDIFFPWFQHLKENIITKPRPLSPVPCCLKGRKDILTCRVDVSFKQGAGDTELYTQLNLRKMPI